jgi:uncharacterized protein (DUF433 family)/8-oxo-dGTP pyrophosphatase MutT (NUDIX family)
MPRLDRIVSDPAVCHGQLAVRGLRYSVENLLELLSSGMTIEEVPADYPDLERDDLLAALEFGALASGRRRVVPLARREVPRRGSAVRPARARFLGPFPGGHVDDGEDPRATVLREASEELRIDGEFHPWFGDDPSFLTVTKTRGEHSHTDVSFWFVLAADRNMRIEADPREANEVRWFALDDPAEWAHDRLIRTWPGSATSS